MDKFIIGGIKKPKQSETTVSVKTEVNNLDVVKISYLPWVEKYRPKKLDEIVFQNEIVSNLKQSILSGKLQHLLFYGPPGTGKTSTILAVSQKLKICLN
jgi:replication-associated recombination protein RarA